MRKMVQVVLLSTVIFFGALPISSFASTDYTSEILALQPALNKAELLQSTSEYAKATNLTEEAVLKQILSELKRDKEKANKEKKQYSTFGNSGGTVVIGASSAGNFYYTPSETAYLDHGHVGLYYTTTRIVESVPGAGVREISAYTRKVDSVGAVIKSVKTSLANRTAAAKWAFDEKGESYSYNFATNRLTGHYGAKNCSKLVWSAYKVKAGLDLDDDGGLGVYPRDVRDAPDTTLVKRI